MRTFAANTGFLFKDLPFLERFEAAKRAGFHALEFHDEAQLEELPALKSALSEVGLPVLGLNTRMGDTAGCAATPGQEAICQTDIDAAAETAKRIGARAVHVLAGKAAGDREVFIANLKYALKKTDKTVLIEPICNQAIDGYFVNTVDQAAEIIKAVGHRRLKILFDVFHVGHEEPGGDVVAAFKRVAKLVGHVQIASFPARTEPSDQELNLADFERLGYRGSYGAEYRPSGAGFAWMRTLDSEPPVVDVEEEN